MAVGPPELVKRGKVVKFVIIMPMARVGSNLLFSNIAQLCGNLRTKLRNENFRVLREASSQNEWLQDFYGTGTEFDVIGSKQSLDTVCDPPKLGDVLCEHQVALIRMRRANVLKVAISGLRARKYAQKTRRDTGVALWGVGRDDEPFGPVALDPEHFLRLAALARLADEKLKAFSPATATYDVEYEDLQRDPDHVTRALCRWLGLEANGEIRSRFIKATPDDLTLAVPNLEDLRAALRRSELAELEPMFDQ
jgi:hypothetical protein